ncbi:MAG: PA0069 family radical SAM protein [Pseudomonadota bacterium]
MLDTQFEARGRAALNNQSGRFEAHQRGRFDDGWSTQDNETQATPTQFHRETPRAVITRNTSPDVPFEQSVNVYRGCEHGCIYCFARPSHSYMGLSAGLDFETQIFTKPNAARLLEEEITRPGYVPQVIAMGTNTDPYQPIERKLRLTRAVLDVLSRRNHPVAITTKSDRILDDIDVLRDMAQRGLVQVCVSVTTLDHQLSRQMEPRAATPAKRLKTIEALAQEGIPTSAMIAPVIPGLTDHEIERILAAAANAGAKRAGWIMLRLPGDVAPLFEQWLSKHVPSRKSRILSTLRAMRGGKLNDPRFGNRMRGEGPVAALIAKRFRAAARRNGLSLASGQALPSDVFDTEAFPSCKAVRPKRATRQGPRPHAEPAQLSLF